MRAHNRGCHLSSYSVCYQAYLSPIIWFTHRVINKLAIETDFPWFPTIKESAEEWEGALIWGGASLILGSFSIDDGNCTCSENVSFKWIPLFQSLSCLLQFAENGKCRRISLEMISWGPHSSLEREKGICRCLFTSSIKLAIRHFHVVVVQGR